MPKKKPKDNVSGEVFWVRPFMPPDIPYRWQQEVSNRPVAGWLKVVVEGFERSGLDERGRLVQSEEERLP